MNAFEACRSIPALAAAHHMGLPLKRSGSKHWACCNLPGHQERTPSLCFFPDGGWHCFGCNRGGDAVAYWQALYDLSSPLDAARQLAAALGLSVDRGPWKPPPKPPEAILRERVEVWRNAWWSWLCDLKHAANEALAVAGGWDDPLFIWALEAREKAERALDRLQQATPADLVQMMAGGGTNERMERAG